MTGFLVQNHYLRFKGAPFCFFRTPLTRPLRWIGVKGVVVPLHGYLNQPDVRAIVVAAVAVAFLVAILTPAVMLITDTAKRLLYARRHVLLVTVNENGDLNDDFGGKPWLTI